MGRVLAKMDKDNSIKDLHGAINMAVSSDKVGAAFGMRASRSREMPSRRGAPQEAVRTSSGASASKNKSAWTSIKSSYKGSASKRLFAERRPRSKDSGSDSRCG